MIERKKPDFAHKPEFKTAQKNEQTDALQRWLKQFVEGSELGPEQRHNFVAYANKLAQMPDVGNEPAADQIKAFDGVANEARRLHNDMKALSKHQCEVLVMYTLDAWRVPVTTEVPAGEPVPMPAPLPASVLERLKASGPGAIVDEETARTYLEDTWEAVNTLLAVAVHASDSIRAEEERKKQERKTNPDAAPTSGKPKQDRAREMVADLARYHIHLSGKAPPEANTAWFANFVRRLGAHMSLHVESEDAKQIKGQPFIGPILVKTAVEMATDSAAIAVAVKADLSANRCFPHEWPMPLNPPVPQNCEKCGAGLNGAPDR